MSCLDLDDAECRRIADPMIDDAMLGIARRDLALHVRHFSVALKSAVDADAFTARCDIWRDAAGAPGSRTLIAVFRKPKAFTLVWHQPFDRVEGQPLLLVTVALKGGRYFIDGFLLQ